MPKKILLISFMIMFLTVPGHTDVPEESVKAAFIFHFLNFTQWDDVQENYYVCIPGDASLRSEVRRQLRGKTVNGREIAVVNRARTCHVLVSDYVAGNNNILTIGPLARGALLEFRVVDDKLKFAVNPERIKQSKLKISSQLLKLAILDEE